MNGYYPESSELGWTIPEDRKHHLIVLVGQMIEHSLTTTTNSEESPTRKGREHPVRMKHEAVQSQRPSEHSL